MGKKTDLALNREELDPGGRGGRALNPVTRFNDELQDVVEQSEIDAEDLVNLGMTESEAQTFVEKFKKFRIKKKAGQKDPDLENEVLELAKKVVKLKLTAMRGSGLDSGISSTGSDSQIKKDKMDDLVDAQMKDLPPEYREMVEEYFKSISDQK